MGIALLFYVVFPCGIPSEMICMLKISFNFHTYIHVSLMYLLVCQPCVVYSLLE